MATDTLRPSGLLDMFGQGDSAFAGWLNPRRNALTQFGAGLIGADSTRDAMRGAAQGLVEGQRADTAFALLQEERAREQQALQEQTAQRNATIELLQKHDPLLAQMVGAGMPIGDAHSYLLDSMRPGGGSTFSQTPVFFTDAQGNQHIGQMASGGGILVNGQVMHSLPEGWKVTARPDNFSLVDMGSGFGTFDPNAGTFSDPVVPISGDPSANMDVELVPGGGRVMTPAAGSPEAIERQRTQRQALASFTAYDQQQGIVTQDISRAINIANAVPSTGVFSLLNAVPGTPQHDLARLIDTIEANVGFAELQEMRDNSPTGGALGQVTERELALLTATMGSLRQSQSKEQFVANLQRLNQQIARSRAAIRDAYMQDFGGGAAQNDPLGIR